MEDRAEISGTDGGFDLVTYFDCLHDMGDPVGALRRTREVLAEGGAVMIVEPMAGNRVEDNFNPIGRAYSAGSAMLCTPNALATGGHGLGTLATDEQIRAATAAAGFSRFRWATERARTTQRLGRCGPPISSCRRGRDCGLVRSRHL